MNECILQQSGFYIPSGGKCSQRTIFIYLFIQVLRAFNTTGHIMTGGFIGQRKSVHTVGQGSVQ